LKLNCHTIKIHHCCISVIIMYTDDSGTQDAYGVAHFRTCEIYIDSGLPRALMRQTVTHELVHALRFSYGESLDLESEEKICDFIAAHFDELKSLRKAVLKAL